MTSRAEELRNAKEREAYARDLARSHQRIQEAFDTIDQEYELQITLLRADGQPDYEVARIERMRDFLRTYYFGVDSPRAHRDAWEVYSEARQKWVKDLTSQK